MTNPKTHTLDVPGATLTYDVRANDPSTEPVLLMFASPMGAAGFETLSGYFTDRTVVTYDPRGAERSKLADSASQSTPDVHGDDLHRLISELDAGPVDIFASSGGATNALALVSSHPEQVRILVAHEPPLAQLLPDREEALAAVRDIDQTYQRDGFGPGMAKFMNIVMHKGPVPADFGDQPADPAMFGLPTEDDGSRDDVLLGQNLVTSLQYRPDIDALRDASTRIVVVAGAESEGELSHRGAEAVAHQLGTKPVTFPSHHGGFLGGEYGQTGDPEAFAAALRKVLEGS